MVDDIKEMNSAIMGSELVEVRDPEAVLEALEEGTGEIPLVLQWDEEPHSVVLHEIRGDRVVFFNAMAPEIPVETGEAIQDEGPPRLAEEPGLESISRDEFVRLFSERAAVCLLPRG